MTTMLEIGRQVDLLHDTWFGADPPRWARRFDQIVSGERFCIGCGCTDSEACLLPAHLDHELDQPCSWAVFSDWQPSICTACHPLPADHEPWRPSLWDTATRTEL